MFGKARRTKSAGRGDVEEHVLGAGALHLVVDGAGDDVARARSLCQRVVVLHERVAVERAQHGAFAAQRLGDQEALRVRVEQHVGWNW